ncbi:MAG: hypothetical protein F2839_03295, partial [Actinobacteria bacterium]|nr:hypothetical protein [Actinomycetota bacterium]
MASPAISDVRRKFGKKSVARIIVTAFLAAGAIALSPSASQAGDDSWDGNTGCQSPDTPWINGRVVNGAGVGVEAMITTTVIKPSPYGGVMPFSNQAFSNERGDYAVCQPQYNPEEQFTSDPEPGTLLTFVISPIATPENATFQDVELNASQITCLLGGGPCTFNINSGVGSSIAAKVLQGSGASPGSNISYGLDYTSMTGEEAEYYSVLSGSTSTAGSLKFQGLPTGAYVLRTYADDSSPSTMMNGTWAFSVAEDGTVVWT